MTWKVLSAGLACRETPPTKKKKPNKQNNPTLLTLGPSNEDIFIEVYQYLCMVILTGIRGCQY
jgi:hypothetical protein